MYLGLNISGHLNFEAVIDQKKILRPYTPISPIDLQGKVKIYNESGQMLETEQLYFDQKNEWFYTEKRYKFTDPKGISFGEGVDFSKDFKIINSQGVSGEVENNK